MKLGFKLLTLFYSVLSAVLWVLLFVGDSRIVMELSICIVFGTFPIFLMVPWMIKDTKCTRLSLFIATIMTAIFNTISLGIYTYLMNVDWDDDEYFRIDTFGFIGFYLMA